MNCHVLHIDNVTFERKLGNLHQGTCTYNQQQLEFRCNDYIREQIGENSSLTAKGRLIGNKSQYTFQLTDVSLPQEQGVVF